MLRYNGHLVGPVMADSRWLQQVRRGRRRQEQRPVTYCQGADSDEDGGAAAEDSEIGELGAAAEDSEVEVLLHIGPGEDQAAGPPPNYNQEEEQGHGSGPSPVPEAERAPRLPSEDQAERGPMEQKCDAEGRARPGAREEKGGEA